MKTNERLALKEIYELMESISDSGFVGDHNMKIPLMVAKKYFEKEEPMSMIDMIGHCVNCDGIVDRNSPYEVVVEEDLTTMCGVICPICVSGYSEEELNEKDIFLEC